MLLDDLLIFDLALASRPTLLILRTCLAVEFRVHFPALLVPTLQKHSRV